MMRVTFWGVRGTFPSTGAGHARYGGDTMCVEVSCGGHTIILDAGSGLRALGAALNAREAANASVIISHLHLDHIMGLPHFAPFWRGDTKVRLHAPRECMGRDDALLSVLRPPLFPLSVEALPADIGVEGFPLGAAFAPAPGVEVRTLALTHQGPCAGIVIRWGGRKLCYVTDHEHGDPGADARLALAAEGADLLIYDATFTDAEMPTHRGWGHSSWQEGVRLKQRAAVRLLALAHHHPDRTDAELDALGQAASALDSNVFFAPQGLSVEL